MNEFIDPKDLESGEVLQGLIKRFADNPCQETLLPVLSCLRDSKVAVAMNVAVDEDEANIYKPDPSSEYHVPMKPLVLSANDSLHFPVFTNVNEIPENLRANYIVLMLPFLEVLELAQTDSGLADLVVDPFSEEPLPLTWAILKVVPSIPSRLKMDTSKLS